MTGNVTSNPLAQGNMLRLNEAMHDVFILQQKTCSLKPPEPFSFSPWHQPTTPSSLNPPVRASVLPEGTEVDSRHGVSCRAPLAPRPAGGHCEHAGVFSHGITLTQAPLIPLSRNVIATKSCIREMEVKQRDGLSG